MQEIRTSREGWLKELTEAYKNEAPVLLVDDAKIGVDPQSHTLFDMGRRASLNRAEISAVCIAAGMSLAGIGIILLAFFDPEPTSKLGLMIGGGVVLVATGGLSAIYILTKKKPPRIKAGGENFGFEISWA